jgi:hypothetical protein
MNKSDLDNDRCLSLDAMRLYQERQLSDKEMHHVEKHLLECELCSDVIEGLEVQEIPVINSIAANVNKKVIAMAGMQPAARPSVFERFKWYIIVPVAVILGWLAWNAINSDSLAPSEKPEVAGNQPAPDNTRDAAPVNNEPASSAPVVREPQGVEKKGMPGFPPPPASDENKEEGLPPLTDEIVSDNKGTSIQKEADPSGTEPSVSEHAGDLPANTGNETGNNTIAPPPVDHSPLRLVEVKVISKVADVGGSRKSSKGGQLGGSKTGSVDDGMQPHEMPVFYGGDEAMKTWLIRNFQNPIKDKNALKGKTTAVIFDVSSKGKIDKIEVTKSLSKELDAEVIRLIGSMPQWKAAAKKGSITVVLAITFK